MRQVVDCVEPLLPLELAALAINIATDPTAAEKMSADGVIIRQLVDRLYHSHDPNMMKLLRNLSQHRGIGSHLTPFVADLVALIEQASSVEAVVELIGILGSMPLGGIAEFPVLVQKCGFLDLLLPHLTPGFSDDDILLEVVIFIGQMAAHPRCAAVLMQTRVLTSLYALITEKQEDDEIVLQILHTFYHMLHATELRFALLQQTQLVIYLLDLLQDMNEDIQRAADLCINVVVESDETWAPQIRQRKFQMYNKEWLEVVDEDEAEEYRDAVALNNAMASLHMNQPLDVAALDDAHYDECGDNIGSMQAHCYIDPVAAQDLPDRGTSTYAMEHFYRSHDDGHYGTDADVFIMNSYGSAESDCVGGECIMSCSSAPHTHNAECLTGKMDSCEPFGLA